MPRLNRLSLPQLDGRASPAAFGAGRSVESFGGGAGPEAYGAGRMSPNYSGENGWARDLEKLGQIGLQSADALLAVEQRDNVITARRNALAAGVDWDKRLLDAKNAAPADAADFTKTFMEGFEKYRRETVDGLSGTQKTIMEDELTQLGGSLYRDAVGFESQRRLKAREEDAKATIQIAQNAIFARPQDHGRILEGVLADIEASDLPEFAKDEMARSTTAALAELLWAANVSRDPYNAKDALTNGDAASLNGLEYNDRVQLLNRSDVEINRIEAEQRAREAEQRRLQNEAEAKANAARQERQFWARFTYDDELEAAKRGETTGPDATKTLVDAFGAKAAPMLAAINRARETAGVVSKLSVMTPAEMQDAIAAGAPSGVNYKDEAEGQDIVRRAAGQVLEERAKNPAAAVANAYPDIRAGLQSDDPQAVGAALRASAAVQKDVFRLPPDQRQLLIPSLKATIVASFKNASTANERLAVLSRYTTDLRDDEVARQVLSEFEAGGGPADARVAMKRYADGDLAAAREILGGLGTKPGDLPKLGEDKQAAITSAVNAMMADPSTTAGLATYRANLGREPDLFHRAAMERDTLLRLTTQYVAAGEDAASASARAAKAVYGDGRVAGSADLGYVEAPRTVDPDDLTAALSRARQTVDLSAMAPAQAPMRPGQEATGAQVQAQAFAMRDYQRRVDAIRNGGIWADDHGGYALLDPATGQRLAFFTLDQLMATLPKRDPAAKLEDVPLPGTAGAFFQ